MYSVQKEEIVSKEEQVFILNISTRKINPLDMKTIKRADINHSKKRERERAIGYDFQEHYLEYDPIVGSFIPDGRGMQSAKKGGKGL